MIIDIENSSLDEIKDSKGFDLFLCALGFENRASAFANSISNLKVDKKVCLQLVREPNEVEKEKLANLGIEILEVEELKSIIKSSYDRIVVDYSVMMKSLYSEIIQIVISQSKRVKPCKLFFSYTHSLFEKSIINQIYVNQIKPLLLTDTKYLDNYTEKKLIIGLGYERLSAIGLVENLQIDYEDVLVFINQTTKNSQHYNECIEVNKEFLSLLKNDQIFRINFFDFNQLRSTMESICFSLNRKGISIIIAPMSVKTFSLYSMVLSLNYDNMKFYNVTSKNETRTYEKHPDTSKVPTVYQIIVKF